MIELKLIFSFLLIIISFIHKIKTDIPADCQIIPSTRKDSSPIPCCNLPQLYDAISANFAYNKTIEILNDKLIDYRNESNFLLVSCIYDLSLLEFTGLFSADKFDLLQYNAYIENNERFNNFTDLFKTSGDKCLNISMDMKVKENQLEVTGLSATDCNFEPGFIINCILVQLLAVSKNFSYFIENCFFFQI